MQDFVSPEALMAAYRWVDAVRTNDFFKMWIHTDANLRLCEAQLWVHANQAFPDVAAEDRDQLAADMARLSSSHPLRQEFERLRVAANAESIPSGDLGAATARRQVADDLEVVILILEGTVPQIIEDETLLDPEQSCLLLMRLTPEGWLVAGRDYNPPVPGWPPESGTPRDIIP